MVTSKALHICTSNSFKVYEVDADAEIQSMLIAVEKDFWNKVQNMIRPEMDGSDAAKNLLDSLYHGGIEEQIVMYNLIHVLTFYDYTT